MTDNDPSGVAVLSLSDAALAKVLKLRAEEPDAESLALWVEISGAGGGAVQLRRVFPDGQGCPA